MNELYFLGMDVFEETRSLVNLTTITCTNGMSDSELSAYQLGIANTLSALKAVLEDSDIAVLNVNGLDAPIEMSVDEVETYYLTTY